MANWHELLKELQTEGSTFDILRRKYLRKLHEATGRNVIVYYSGWLQKPEAKGFEVNDSDKLGFMTVIHGLDRSKGLDLFLHTPGGNTAATESLVEYIRSIFGTDVRAVIPQIAMSAGTMIACSAKEIIMGKHSNLGPIDPQIGGIAAHGIIEEFNRAFTEISMNPAKAYVWQPIVGKYSPTLVGECEKAIKWSNDMVREWLKSGMFESDPNADSIIGRIISELGDHALNLSHARHISKDKCKDIGLKIVDMESYHQEEILSIHHACIHTLSSTGATKIIENHEGIARMDIMQNIILQPN